MIKHFEKVNEGDTIYLLTIRNSSLFEYNGKITFLPLKVIHIVDYPLNRFIKLSDGVTEIFAKKSLPYHTDIKVEDEIWLSADIYATSKEECLHAARTLILERKAGLRAIERNIKDSDMNLGILDTELTTLGTCVLEEEKEEFTEEFASMALS